MSEQNKRRKQRREMICVATIGGDYHRSRGTIQELEPYEVECRFDQEMVEKGVLSVFKNTLAPAIMPKQFPGFQGLHTHEIRSSYMVDQDGQEWDVDDLRLMNRDQLIEYIDAQSNPPCQVDPSIYADNGALRQAIDDWHEAVRTGKTEDFVRNQDKRRDKQGADIELATRALELNKVEADPKQLQLQEQLGEFASAQDNSDNSPPIQSVSNSEPAPKPKGGGKSKAAPLAQI